MNQPLSHLDEQLGNKSLMASYTSCVTPKSPELLYHLVTRDTVSSASKIRIHSYQQPGRHCFMNYSSQDMITNSAEWWCRNSAENTQPGMILRKCLYCRQKGTGCLRPMMGKLQYQNTFSEYFEQNFHVESGQSNGRMNLYTIPCPTLAVTQTVALWKR